MKSFDAFVACCYFPHLSFSVSVSANEASHTHAHPPTLLSTTLKLAYKMEEDVRHPPRRLTCPRGFSSPRKRTNEWRRVTQPMCVSVCVCVCVCVCVSECVCQHRANKQENDNKEKSKSTPKSAVYWTSCLPENAPPETRTHRKKRRKDFL
ncbi:hypothetical protein ABB37_07875 [Leptomonas pyrrhocoris]|uniref:Uncharacterized protein n=1 Tax=Leptomonas pyrrhocoris TaxID=157538 RepID=A0A0M9FUB2_LEPPY|nr:hypothetical protein ABB37_07875 [Leptomonas pyrrhocoris]KPA76099.1 hypothetical protein ABB37_07875 [Leptomonas pyrrhocoris]|eukprot:XP_015654538.1 hypothetical protein ABB37_07875 [Leptomonas pyrrhocoris]